jgi:transposase
VARERDEEARRLFRQQIEQVPVEKLVFLDECGFASNMRRLYGWALGGARCVEVAPHTRTTNRSCLGAFSLPTSSNLTGLWLLWQKLGAWNSLLFEAFVVDELLPRLPEGSVLVLDNASIHQSQSLPESVMEAGHTLLFLPPYSPDFNPIELVWSWLKNAVRHLKPEGDEQRERAIRLAQSQLPPQHAQAWFRKCGLTLLLSD